MRLYLNNNTIHLKRHIYVKNPEANLDAIYAKVYNVTIKIKRHI